MSESNEALSRRWFREVWNEKRSDTIHELLTPECVLHVEGGADIVGPDQFQKYYLELITVFPDLQITVAEVMANDEGTATRWTVEATHEGTGYGLEPTGKKVIFQGITMVHIRDGKFVEGWDCWNSSGLMQVLAAE